MNTAVPLKSAKAETLRLPDHRDAYYGGEWHKPKSGAYVDSINPGTAEFLVRSPTAAQPTSMPPSPRRKKPSTAGATRRRWSARGSSSASPRCCARTPTNWR